MPTRSAGAWRRWTSVSSLAALALGLEGRLRAGLPLEPADGAAIARAWLDVRQAFPDEGLLSPDELRSIEAPGGP